MKVILLLCSLLVAMDSTLFSQVAVILQPGHPDGKDAEIWSLRPNAVFEDDLVRGVAWTFQALLASNVDFCSLICRLFQ